jgi:hypothetical protein
MRALIPAVAALSVIVMAATPSWAEPMCKPIIIFTDARYAEMELPKLQRTWTAAFTVDASRCATSSGDFSILFRVWKENAPDTEYAESFRWSSGLNVISKEFWVDEAVGAYAVNDIAPCRCANYKK